MKHNTEVSENRRALPKFFLMLLAALIAGVLMGICTSVFIFAGLGARLAEGLNNFLRVAVPWGLPLTVAVFLPAALWLYAAAKRQYQGWDGEDEDTIDSADEKLSWVLLLNSLQLILSMFFFAAASRYQRDAILAAVAVFLASCFLVILMQQKVVDLTKRMNPEKRGSVYDTKFQKKWIDSCDEAERQQIGQAALRAYTVTARGCLLLWLILVIADMIVDIGVLPVFLVMLLWGVLQTTYALECIRLSKKAKHAGPED